MSGYRIESFGTFFFLLFFIITNFNYRYTTSAPPPAPGDEQAPCLAPEKRDFTATYTLGATTRQITYY